MLSVIAMLSVMTCNVYTHFVQHIVAIHLHFSSYFLLSLIPGMVRFFLCFFCTFTGFQWELLNLVLHAVLIAKQLHVQLLSLVYMACWAECNISRHICIETPHCALCLSACDLWAVFVFVMECFSLFKARIMENRSAQYSWPTRLQPDQWRDSSSYDVSGCFFFTV